MRGTPRVAAGDEVELLLMFDGEVFLVKGHVAWSDGERSQRELGITAPIEERVLDRIAAA